MDGAGIEKSRGGRPAERGEAKRSPINMRTTPAIRAALEEAAERGGRSLAQEIEQRLERSIEEESRRGGPQTAALIAAILSDIADIEAATGKQWHEDIATFGAVRYAISEQLADRLPIPREQVREAQKKIAGADAVMEVTRAIEAGALPKPQDWDAQKALNNASDAFKESAALLEHYDELANEGIRLFEELRESRDFVAIQRRQRRGA